MNLMGITVRECPEIMSDLENSGYFGRKPAIWQINRISEHRVTFYLVNHGGKSEDGSHDLWEEIFIFIPISNVIGIHNVSEQFFINESLRSLENKR